MSANTVTTAQGGGSGSVSSSSGGMAANSDSQNQQKQSTTSLNGVNNGDLSSIANRTIELICSDTILNDSEMNLRTLKHLIWKGTGDLTILYRVNASNKSMVL